MKTLYYDQMFGIFTDQILKDIDSNTNVERVILCGETEWEIASLTHEFINQLKARNIDLKIIHGASRNEYYEQCYQQLGLDIGNVIFWDTHWINYSYLNLIGASIRPESYVVDRSKLKHKFVSLNNRSHFHRCVFIDEMAKQQQLDKGIVTWVKHLHENSDYPYKYFNNEQRLLSDSFVNKLDAFLIPDQHHESLLHVITEATSNVPFITEKTCIPLFLKKPFLVLGCKGYSENLTKLGFKLHDDIFDYSYDAVDDIYLRTELFVNNLKILEDTDIVELYDRMYPTIKHNYDRAIEILQDNSFIPKEMIEYAELRSDTPLVTKIHIFLNQHPKQLKLYSIWLDNPNYLNEINNTISEVIVDNTVEVEYATLQNDPNGLAKLIDSCEIHNVPMTLLTSNHSFNDLLDNDRANKINIVDDRCFWIAKHLQAMLTADNRTANENLGYDMFDKNVGLSSKIDYLYLTMNNLVKRHRCQMMDMLAKYDLIDYGAIVWRNAHRYETYNDFQYKYWTPKKMFLDIEDNNTSYVNQNLLPKEYKNCFMQLVAESEDNLFFLSEKTAVPLLCNKPFLIVSSRGFHKNLVDLGFVLYDELFDYSFDCIDDQEIRIEKIVANVNRLKDCSKDMLLELTETIKPKLEHNRNVAISHVKNSVTKLTPYLTKIEEAGYNSQLGLLKVLGTYAHRL